MADEKPTKTHLLQQMEDSCLKYVLTKVYQKNQRKSILPTKIWRKCTVRCSV